MHVNTMCMHMLTHLVQSIRKWGPLCNSWTQWSERFVRRVRNASPTENRGIAALSNGYAKNKRSQPVRVPVATQHIQQACRWWHVAPVSERHRDPTCTLSLEEKITCLVELKRDGCLPQRFIENVMTKIESKTPVQDRELVFWQMGDGIRSRSTYMKTVHAMRRSDEVRDRTYGISLYGEDAKPYLCAIQKIVCWSETKDSSRVAYAFKIKNYNMTKTVRCGSTVYSARVTGDRKTARGEWLGQTAGISSRQPVLRPKINVASAHAVVFVPNSYTVCTVVSDDHVE